MENKTEWNTAYEWKVVTIMALGFGLVGIDRFMIMPLFPVIMKDLGLDYQDLGYITGALSLGWGAAAIFMGNLSDRIGHRKVLIPAILIFSLLAGLSGLAVGVASLCLIRLVMGLSEGAFTPASIIATIDASKPTRHGRNVGLQQCLNPLLGLAVAPIVVTQLLKVVPWHWIFALVSIPGLIVAFLVYKVVRDTKATAAEAHTAVHDVARHKWSDVFRYRNIPLNICGMFCWLTVLVVLSAFFPSYLVDYKHLSLQSMGFVMSAIGFGSTAGTIVIPAISDWIGRKPTMLLSVLGAIVFIWALKNCGPVPFNIFAFLFLTLFCIFGMIALTVGPISAESVPATLMSTASGLVIGLGEFFGGGVAPAIAGYVAKHFGIQYSMYVAIVALVIGLVVVCFLEETRRKPRQLQLDAVQR